MSRKRSVPAVIISVILVIAVWAYREYVAKPGTTKEAGNGTAAGSNDGDTRRTPDTADAPRPPETLEDALRPGELALIEAFRARRSDLVLEASANVFRILEDDNEGSRHQRFILKLKTGQTVLVAHNIDLAPRVPVSVGDKVYLKGEYEWTDQGGVLHWTHRDPANRHAHGWIELDGKRYE